MTELERVSLRLGDIVRSAMGDAYVIIGVAGAHPIAVRALTVTNAREWELVTKHTPPLESSL